MSRKQMSRTRRTVVTWGFWLSGILLLNVNASAQTALVAHRSHGGTARTFRPARSAHSFGILAPIYQLEKIVWLDQARAVYHWRLKRPGNAHQPPPKTRLDTVDVQLDTGRRQLAQVVEQLRQRYPKARLVGFDSSNARAAWPAAH